MPRRVEHHESEAPHCRMRRFFFAAQDEVCRRFNNRKNQFLFRDMLLKMLEGDHLENKKLTEAA